MTLSQLQEPIWHRRACHDCMPQFNKHKNQTGCSLSGIGLCFWPWSRTSV